MSLSPPLTVAELSASDDSSLSDGLLLEEGEMDSLGTQSRLWEFAEFASEDFQWDWKVQGAGEGRSTSQGSVSDLMSVPVCPGSYPIEGGGCAELLFQWVLLMRKGKMSSSLVN